MEYKQFLNLLSQKKQTVFVIAAVFLILASILTFSQPLRYGATSTLLVVQNYGPSTDAYAVSRANQFLSNLLAQVVYSDSFFEKVLASGYGVNQNIFSADANKRKKQWREMVYTRAVADTGMIVLKTYHQNKKTADLINQAVAYTLMTKNGQYHGLGDSVKVKIIDNSTLSNLPVKPNVALNLLLGLLGGLVASLYLIYFFPGLSLGFRRKKSQAPAEKIVYSEPEARPEFNWPRVEIEQTEPALAYNGAEEEVPPIQDEEKIEPAGGERDDFDPYFSGNINNLFFR